MAYFQNTFQDYLWGLGIFLAAIILLKLFQVIILQRLKKLAQKTKTEFDDVLIGIIEKVRPPFYFFIALYLAGKFLTLPDLADKIIDGLFIAVITYQITRALQSFIDYWTRKMATKPGISTRDVNRTAVKSIRVIIKILLWVFAVLLILSNWGINITSLVAGLGIGGIAVALALQNILGDIFSFFAILIDKPFQVGDFVSIGKDSGVVEKIGLKTTRLRTLQGEELVVANKELTSARIQNFRKMLKRRVTFTLGVCYETKSVQLKKIPQIIKGIIEKIELAEFERANFKSYGDFSLNFEVVYYINSADYNQYMDIQEAVNLAIKEQFEKEGIEFAYPTQTVFVKK